MSCQHPALGQCRWVLVQLTSTRLQKNNSSMWQLNVMRFSAWRLSGDHLLLASRALLPFLLSSRSACMQLLGHDVTAPLSVNDIPAFCAFCPFCRSASAESGCPSVHPLRCSVTVSWHSGRHRTWPCFQCFDSAPISMRLLDALFLREAPKPNSSDSTRQVPPHPAGS